MKTASALLLRRPWAPAVAALQILFAAGGSAQAAGNIPQGLWVLNTARSRELAPGDQTLWVIKDDGESMVWVGVATDPQHRVRVNSWDGTYGGPPAPVVGSDMVSQITSSAPGTMHNAGEIKGLGKYHEDCVVSQAGKRMICHGEVASAKGVLTWKDDFDWMADSPRPTADAAGGRP